MSTLYYESSIQHFGILGMKWGIRRYQNKDGSLTSAGRKHQQKQMEKIIRKERTAQHKLAIENLKIQEQRKTAQAKAKLEEEKRQLELDKKGQHESGSASKSKASVGDLSDDELKHIIDRVTLEKKYLELVNPPTTKSKKDNSFWSGIARDVTKELLTTSTKEIATGMGKKISKTFFDNDGGEVTTTTTSKSKKATTK